MNIKWIPTTKARKILNRSMNGTRFLCKRYKVPSKREIKGTRSVWLFSESHCVELAKRLRPRKFKINPNPVPLLEVRTGYMKISMPQHPRAMCDGYIYEHWLVAEKKLGRYLTKDEQVHHINRIRDDNRPENLTIYASRADHMKKAHRATNAIMLRLKGRPDLEEKVLAYLDKIEPKGSPSASNSNDDLKGDKNER